MMWRPKGGRVRLQSDHWSVDWSVSRPTWKPLSTNYSSVFSTPPLSIACHGRKTECLENKCGHNDLTYNACRCMCVGPTYACVCPLCECIMYVCMYVCMYTHVCVKNCACIYGFVCRHVRVCVGLYV